MKITALRWLLDPATSLLALRLRAQEDGPMSYDAAWRLARVTRHPDEMGYRLHGHRSDGQPQKNPAEERP
ncbi:hypothetical protein M2163_001110 [Streptomyces sp. SAI-135]|uniref:hypothetical protein n=1 Tax=unclassified Streptomyces TaxID=2593676 RepID=UPI0024749E95|nr:MULTISPECIES: hypothetical protein [unclassified Streptomyces]MDH6521896.1 hypothetical protein [Streptomyces sp. SAI-090]MDH6573265.1 hypothetical protein [Streptomyces sp. SAI-117]MDH6614002.1 hypothetical protein [Streptomyces sp. SAI-135]